MTSISDFTRVAFDDVSEVILLTPLKCYYTIGCDLHASAKDWVGLFKVGWRSTKDYVCYEWCPLPENYQQGQESSGSVIFKVESLPKDITGEFYQFCYVSGSGTVCGVSPPFQFQETSIDCVENDENPSMLFVHSSGCKEIENGLREHVNGGMQNHVVKDESNLSSPSSGLVFSNADELNSLTERLRTLDLELSTERSSNDALKNKLQQALEHAEDLKKQKTDLDKEIVTLKSTNEDLHQKLQAVSNTSELNKKQAENEVGKEKQLKTELAKREQEISELVKRCRESNDDEQKSKKELEETKQRLEQLAAEKENMTSMIENYTAKHAEWKSLEEIYKKEIAELKRRAGAAELSASNGSPVDGDRRAGDGFGGFSPRHGSQFDQRAGNEARENASGELDQTCPYCNESFPQQFIYDHIATHEDKQCPICSGKFPADTDLNEFVRHVDGCISRAG